MTIYMQRQTSYKVHMNTTSNGELSDHLCDSVNRGLTLVRLIFTGANIQQYQFNNPHEKDHSLQSGQKDVLNSNRRKY